MNIYYFIYTSKLYKHARKVYEQFLRENIIVDNILGYDDFSFKH